MLAFANNGMGQSAIAGCVGLTRATVNRIPWRHAATGTLVPGKSTEAPRKTTPCEDCFVENGLTGSLHKCSCLDSADEKFVWNEGWPENHQQPAFVMWLPIDPQGSPC